MSTLHLVNAQLVNEGRIDFDQLFNNLVASGSAHHATVVHNVLNELLTGWMFEVKSEFGGAVEGEVNRLAETLPR